MKAYRINKADTVAVALENLEKGKTVFDVDIIEDIPAGHKFATKTIKKGEDIIKYGQGIGIATKDISEGEWAHTHNIKSGLEKKTYSYNKIDPKPITKSKNYVFNGYKRENRSVGTRNYLYIVATVGCVNYVVNALSNFANGKQFKGIDKVIPVTHQFGCSQLGDDHNNTAKILAGIIHNPNAGGALVVGLGCENNNIKSFLPFVGKFDSNRVKFLNSQDFDDEIETGKSLINEIAEKMAGDRREECSISKLIVGLKCGGSDAFSGITANPLIGEACDRLVESGATVLMTEVPEMFGAEERIFERCKDIETFYKAVDMINSFKDYFITNNLPIYENPSPGNKEGGITTLEEKSLGCTQKSGGGEINGILNYAERVSCNGLHLLSAPGNDIVAVSALAASGASMILFSTGRGTPLGSLVPVIKISSNTQLAIKKSNWIDFDSGMLLNGEILIDNFIEKIVAVANGEKTKAELNYCYDFAIFKNGVTL